MVSLRDKKVCTVYQGFILLVAGSVMIPPMDAIK